VAAALGRQELRSARRRGFSLPRPTCPSRVAPRRAPTGQSPLLWLGDARTLPFSFKGRGASLTSLPATAAQCFPGSVVLHATVSPSLFRLTLILSVLGVSSLSLSFLLSALRPRRLSFVFSKALLLLNSIHTSFSQFFLTFLPAVGQIHLLNAITALNSSSTVSLDKSCDYFINVTFPARISHTKEGTSSVFSYISLLRPSQTLAFAINKQMDSNSIHLSTPKGSTPTTLLKLLA
jgi:hypothetical protein